MLKQQGPENVNKLDIENMRRTKVMRDKPFITVAELIEQLQKLPHDHPVVVPAMVGGYDYVWDGPGVLTIGPCAAKFRDINGYGELDEESVHSRYRFKAVCIW